MSNFLLDSLYQDFNISIKPVKPTKKYMKQIMLIIFYEIFFVSFMSGSLVKAFAEENLLKLNVSKCEIELFSSHKG